MSLNRGDNISVGLSDGTGHFTIQPNVSVRIAANPVEAAFADINKDGKMDLLFPAVLVFSILLGNGTGGCTWNSHHHREREFNRAADFDGDGNVDLAMVSEETNGKTSVVRGDGTSGFPALQLSLGNFPSDLAVADLNNDNKLDLAVAISRQGPVSEPTKIKHRGASRRWRRICFASQHRLRSSSSALLQPISTEIRRDLITANQLVNNLTVVFNTCGGSSQSTSFTISGVVTDGNGQGIANVTMILQSDAAEPQIVFTNQSGNYSFLCGQCGHNLKLLHQRQGFPSVHWR